MEENVDDSKNSVSPDTTELITYELTETLTEHIGSVLFQARWCPTVKREG